MKYHVFRLVYGQDLKQSIIEYCRHNKIHSAAVVTVVGCVYQACLRLADGKTVKTFVSNYEIVSFEGTISNSGVHFHISLSDVEGQTIGGHLMDNTLVNTTAEIVLVDLSNEYQLTREYDEATGYDELVVKSRL